ncbi:MAG TPA: oligosaccharide flippase family protein [Ktedonobacteraceae bacterium]|nr:oligosaccharide flippase family protein [Ktedonobacteraceae bacterium]
MATRETQRDPTVSHGDSDVDSTIKLSSKPAQYLSAPTRQPAIPPAAGERASEAALPVPEPTTEKVIPPRFSLSFKVNQQKAPLPPRNLIPPHVKGDTAPSLSRPKTQFKKPWLISYDDDMRPKPLDITDAFDDPFELDNDFNDFDDSDNIDDDFANRATIPMMVLEGISRQQGQEAPVMQSEISGAAGGAAIVGVGNIAGNVLKYVGNLVIARSFSPGAYGLFNLSNSFISLIVSLFNLGLDDAMVRYTAIYRKKQQRGLLQGLTIFCSVGAGVAGLIGAILLMFAAPYYADISREPGITTLLLMMAPLVPLTCMQGMWSAGLQGFKAFKWRVISQRFVVPVVLILVMLVALIFDHTLTSVVVATFVSSMVSAVLCLWFFYRMVATVRAPGPLSRVSDPIKYELREWLGFALPNFLTSVIDTVLEAVDTLLLGFFGISDVAIGQYSAANKIANFIAQPLLSFNVMFAPTIAELHGMGEQEKLSIMFKIVTKWTIIFSLPIFLIAVLFSRSLLNISGDGYVNGWPLLIALSVGFMVNAGTGSVGYMLTMTGYQKLAFINSLVAVVINTGLGVFLTPRYGAMGTAIATGLALAAVNILRLVQVKILLHIHPYQWDMLKPLAAGLISSLITWVLINLIHSTHLYIMVFTKKLPIDLVLVPVFLVLYAGLIVLLRFSAEDKIVLSTLGKKLGRGKKKPVRK